MEDINKKRERQRRYRLRIKQRIKENPTWGIEYLNRLKKNRKKSIYRVDKEKQRIYRRNLYKNSIIVREKNRIKVANRWAKIHGRGELITPKQWYDLKQKQKNKCNICGIHNDKEKLTIDHIIPLSKGGIHVIDNIQGLCRPCNSRKKNKMPHLGKLLLVCHDDIIYDCPNA